MSNIENEKRKVNGSIISTLYVPTNKMLDKTHPRSPIYKFFRKVFWLYYIHLPCIVLSNADAVMVYTIFNLIIFFSTYSVCKHLYKLII
ncbi:uncharacterized protein SCDLUD_003698 [Saccharomycodes ludwigii]|uniref:uncharacterized protein n=1 Tax=Saccharomycodes ludwigii TaxID=36035 RepID=UPI001E8C2D94|nr:hypothetical protein SCDLUD_003698 [Saccharomycodes ludwigii]KAH3900698.1 hypothetical protein SCDLUD_003698 [Saccharomycodes ludwigii]